MGTFSSQAGFERNRKILKEAGTQHSKADDMPPVTRKSASNHFLPEQSTAARMLVETGPSQHGVF